MTKHTPGSWEVMTRDVNELYTTFVGVKIGSEYIELGRIDCGKTHANAHLIAAAPLMLEALLEQCCGCAEEKDYCLEHDCKVYMAIKAAKGEQE